MSYGYITYLDTYLLTEDKETLLRSPFIEGEPLRDREALGALGGSRVQGTVRGPGGVPLEGIRISVWGAHEIAHTWRAYAGYMKNGERRSPQDGRSGHWTVGLHTPTPFALWGPENGSVMGGAYWRENSGGTFTATSGWTTRGGGFSRLDLYLMGLATPDEVPDMFVLHNLEQVGEERDGPYTGEKEIVTMEQVLAAMGRRNPPSERSRKVFNTEFVYFLLPGQEPDPELLREHAGYRDPAVAHWRHVTGGRGQLTAEIDHPGWTMSRTGDALASSSQPLQSDTSPPTGSPSRASGGRARSLPAGIIGRRWRRRERPPGRKEECDRHALPEQFFDKERGVAPSPTH